MQFKSCATISISWLISSNYASCSKKQRTIAPTYFTFENEEKFSKIIQRIFNFPECYNIKITNFSNISWHDLWNIFIEQFITCSYWCEHYSTMNKGYMNFFIWN